ncbi:MAG: hypothetical protein ACYTGR_10535 [Planctomycetota bacterium]
MIDHVRSLARTRLERRRIIVCVGPLVPGTKVASMLLGFGAERCLVIADGRGTGTPDEDERIEHVIDAVEGEGLMGGIRAYQARLLSPGRATLAAIDRFDPDRNAEVFVASIYPISAVAGRPVIGLRHTTWMDLEDKVVIDQLWSEAGIARSVCAVVPAHLDALRAAARAVDAGGGSCWCGDAREGFNGGASYVRWIRPGDEAAAANAAMFFGDHCDRVRVMPFLDGLPCSIHGMVFPDDVAVFRPVEMMVLRRPGASTFCYAGLDTFWDPAADDRDALRATARSVGAALRRSVGYRGGFTVDGVMTADGFRPTELNARLGAGVGTIASACPDLPLEILDLLVREDRAEGVDVADFERTVVERADARRGGGGWLVVDEPTVAATRTWQVHVTGSTVELAPDEATGNDDDAPRPSDGSLTLGPAAGGSHLRFSADPDRTPVGPSLAPRVARVFAACDACLGTTIGPVEPAPPRR